MNSKIVVFPVSNPYMNAILHDFLEKENVYRCKYVKSRWLRKIQYFHTSIKANKCIKLPLQSLWYPTYMPVAYNMGDDYIFLFYQGTPLGYDKDFLCFLRKNYPGAKLCYYWNNISSTVSDKYISFVNNNYDVVYTFDTNDVKKYGWRFYDAMYSDISKFSLPTIKASDIFYVGSAKGRLSLLHEIYDKFMSMGLTCDFHIVNVSPEEQTRTGIVYNKRMSYTEVLGHSASTKIILELVQEGQVGTTLRTLESIILRKKLLTNNRGILESKLYTKYVNLFDNIDDINPSNILSAETEEDNIEQMISYLGAERFIKDLEEA